jgi:protein SPT2
VEDEYYGEEEDYLDDFIVYTDDEEDKRVKRQKLHQQQDDEEEDEEFDEDEEAPVGMQEVLSLREHLKDKIRRKNAAMAAGLGKGSSSVKQQTAKDR